VADIIELTVKGSDKIVAYACGVCRHVVAPSDPAPDVDARYRRDAEEHCRFVCARCGETKPRHEAGRYGYGPDCLLLCKPCGSKHLAELSERNDRARIEKAKKLTEAEWEAEIAAGRLDSYLCVEDEHFVDGLEEARAYVLDHSEGDIDGSFPEYVEACVGRKFSMDAGRLVEWALESAEMPDETISDHQPSEEDVAELQAFLDAWAAKQNIRWFETCGILVRLDPEANRAALEECRREVAQ
jgi:hypothetical protein